VAVRHLKRTQGPQSIACWLFAAELAFTAFVVGFVAGDETVLVAAGREIPAASQVTGFLG